VLQPAVFVPESVTGMELLENFRSSGGQVAFVIDEYGEVLGLVTLKISWKRSPASSSRMRPATNGPCSATTDHGCWTD
jgi:hypothetical protein